ncbi:MAG: hypothetical protein JW880_00660 [Candidatus Thermoplasmatota archaeon]|nr:hypothetical protein [Candidatus Thermoplasmatota archaeon]
MSPKQAWVVFSFLVVLTDFVAMIALVAFGYPEAVVIASGMIILLFYFYVLYKRYNVEVISESDLALFTDLDDLRILCTIYGLDKAGKESDLNERLLAFSRAHSSRAFTWVAPRLVRSVGEALEVPQVPRSTNAVETRPLTGGQKRSDSRLMAIGLCPVCDAKLPRKGTVCMECGADLEFYSVLQESKVGKRLVSEKSRVVRRKLRKDVSASGGKR